MVPTYFVQLEKIPLSSNGKADKKNLPDPSALRIKEKFRDPQDETERAVLRICSEVLKKREINLNENFFELGGHSLNAVRVISKIQKEFNVDLPLKEIFYNPVLLNIAEKVKELTAQKDFSEEKPEEETIIVPMSDDELNLLSNLQFDDDEE